MTITEALNELLSILTASEDKSATLNAIAAIVFSCPSQDELPALQTGVVRPS